MVSFTSAKHLITSFISFFVKAMLVLRFGQWFFYLFATANVYVWVRKNFLKSLLEKYNIVLAKSSKKAGFVKLQLR